MKLSNQEQPSTVFFDSWKSPDDEETMQGQIQQTSVISDVQIAIPKSE